MRAVRLTSAFNASYGRSGRRRELRLGLCLWAILEPQERVALIGHELGRALNGDLRNNVFVRRALLPLAAWRELLRPRRARHGRRYGAGSLGGGMVGIAELITPVLLAPLALIVGILLGARPVRRPAVVLDAGRNAAIDAELAAVVGAITRGMRRALGLYHL